VRRGKDGRDEDRQVELEGHFETHQPQRLTSEGLVEQVEIEQVAVERQVRRRITFQRPQEVSLQRPQERRVER
jgi:hypothetical protein